ncbi:FadR family transcriptional regulator [Actinomadura barringtoniae]|uniref:FadR family transcriptional regulator n=1 Tax=Actinomadura barringtoniae TaxID=1427535 RepID=A0A939PBD9_9ACTN|nr:FadR/GntR family transcriptional regulator [Actinomadura barringtoniae]MBO2449505.1 FadR family transcriptional regulator [Actinomadura barringtoniae]
MAISEDVIEKIKAMIISGEIRPGERLPREPDLAERLGVGRNTLREAVRALIAMQILVIKRGDGTYVSSLEPHLLLENLAFAADVSSGRTAQQLLQVRRLLEPQATALAASLVTDGDLRTLQKILDRCGAATNPEEFVAHDSEFHRTIADIVGNPVLSTLLSTLSTHTQRVRVLRGAKATDALSTAHREHQAILRALAARDPQLAASTSAVHIAAVEQWVQDASED